MKFTGRSSSYDLQLASYISLKSWIGLPSPARRAAFNATEPTSRTEGQLISNEYFQVFSPHHAVSLVRLERRRSGGVLPHCIQELAPSRQAEGCRRQPTAGGQSPHHRV